MTGAAGPRPQARAVTAGNMSCTTATAIADDRDMLTRTLPTFRPVIGALAMACLATPVAAQAPVNRRLSVRRAAEGFALLGFRAAKGSENRFKLSPGMPAADLRAQLQSVAWDELSDNLADQPARAVASRRRYGGSVENLLVELDRPEGRVRQIAYEISPASYSRANLVRLLQATFGPATVIVDEPDHFDYRYLGTNQNQGLIIDAQRLASEKTKWRIRYRLLDLTPSPAETEGPELIDIAPLIPIWPLPDETEAAPTTTQPAKGELRIPGDLEKGLKQVYPPPQTQPAP